MVALRILNKHGDRKLPSRFRPDDGKSMHTIDDFDIGIVGPENTSAWMRNVHVPHISQRAFDNGDVIVVYFCPGRRLVWMAKRGHGIVLPPTRIPPAHSTTIAEYSLGVCMRGQSAAARVEHIVAADVRRALLRPRGLRSPRDPDNRLRNVVFCEAE